MKKFKIYSLILMVFGMFACTDLSEKPLSRLSPDGFYQTPKDVETVIFGAYGRMANNFWWGRKLITTLMLRSDMVDIGNPATPVRRVEINNFTNGPTNGMTTAFWPVTWQIISAANSAIAGAESLDGIEESRRNELLGEAMFVRAFGYFMLVRLFGEVPLIVEEVTDPESLTTISKSSVTDIYQSIISDLKFGKENMPWTQNARSRASRGTAATMLADVYLTLGQYDLAYENAKWVIDNSGQLEYNLEPDYQSLYDATKQDGIHEIIFDIDFKGLVRDTDGDDLTGPMTGVRGADMQGWGVMVPSLDVYNSFDVDDYRTDVAFFTEASFDNGAEIRPYTEFPNEKRPHIAKFRRFPGNAQASGRQSDNNYAIYRYAEVLLIAAEAGNEITGPNSELEGYVNLIRERARNADGTPHANPPDVTPGLPQDEFREMVLEERRIELSFESKRWFDIVRRDMGEEAYKGANSLEPHDNFKKEFYLFPIPQDELDRNPNLLPQNPGY